MEKNMPAYEVLSPWADADPIPFKGIMPRIDKIEGKKIGLLRNSKRTSEPTLKRVEEKLKQKFPSASFSWFANLKPNERAIATDYKNDFEKWVASVDAVIASYGD